jgi:hypothetical protein
MSVVARRAPAYSLASLALLILAAVALEGCSQKSSREQEYSKNNPKAAEQPPVGKFAGHVTVDGVAQVGTDNKLFVFLTDPQHPEKWTNLTPCKQDGSFEFMTYFPGDGVRLGKYVVGFVELQALKKAKGGGPAGGPRPYRGPDSLKNLYNDPDKNKDVQEFVVEVTQPGRTDYEFNLAVAGKEAGVPGPHAVKAISEAPGDF